MRHDNQGDNDMNEQQALTLIILNDAKAALLIAALKEKSGKAPTICHSIDGAYKAQAQRLDDAIQWVTDVAT